MNGFQPIFLILCFLSFLACGVASADSYRCGRKLIKTGDSTGDVVRICGQPRFKDRGHEKISIEGFEKNTPVQRWYYKKNSRSLERVVLIHRGRVVAIQVGER